MTAPTDDGLGGSDHTILRPSTAGSRRAATPIATSGSPPASAGARASSAPSAPLSSQPPGAERDLSAFFSGGRNPLLQSAIPLLLLGQRLRVTASVPDVASLRRQVFEAVRAFESQARAADVLPEDVLAARYALCTALDEAALNTPWGAQSEWASQTLLVAFHREAFGGEKFFEILKRINLDPNRYINLMELMYVCLALGFEGRYRLEERGASGLLEVQHEVYQHIRSVRGAVEPELSPHWRGVTNARNRLVRYVPLWVVALGVVAVLIVVYIGLYASLGQRSGRVMSSLAGIGLEPMYRGQLAPTGGLRLKALLAPQELRGEVSVDEQADRTTVTLPAPDLFASGSAAVNPRYQTVISAIGAALNRVPGRVTVIGHTDDQPVHSLSFANNSELSRARALAVIGLLKPALDSPGRLEAVGRGSDQPRYLPADVPENRARNRRVEIVQRQGF
jgi:type VI secretion system protein ImpK